MCSVCICIRLCVCVCVCVCVYACVYGKPHLNRRSTHKVKRVSKGYGVTCRRIKKKRYERGRAGMCVCVCMLLLLLPIDKPRCLSNLCL